MPEAGKRTEKLRRTMMITPGNRADRIGKAAQLDVDAVVLDFEDGVAPADKDAARKTVAKALREVDFGHRERLVRTNAVSTAEFDQDIASIPFRDVDALFVPKVEHPGEVAKLDEVLSAKETELGLKQPIDVVATIETPRGLFNAMAIVDASERISALFFGSGDYSAATGSAVSARAFEYPRAAIVAAASVGGRQAIDAAYFAAVKDADATRADAELGRELGFDGKLIFHPNQIAPCNEVFSPSDAEIAHAQKVVAAHQAATESGDGVAYVDGTFVAIDIVLMAERVLRKAELINARTR